MKRPHRDRKSHYGTSAAHFGLFLSLPSAFNSLSPPVLCQIPGRPIASLHSVSSTPFTKNPKPSVGYVSSTPTLADRPTNTNPRLPSQLVGLQHLQAPRLHARQLGIRRHLGLPWQQRRQRGAKETMRQFGTTVKVMPALSHHYPQLPPHPVTLYCLTQL